MCKISAFGKMRANGLIQSGPWAEVESAVELDHLTLLVVSLGRSVEFYEKALGLVSIPEPFHDGKHAWLRIGDHQSLHVVVGTRSPAPEGIDVHVAFRVAALDEVMARLETMGVPFRNFDGSAKVNVRPDGVRQIYLQDPDGYWIEVNENRY